MPVRKMSISFCLDNTCKDKGYNCAVTSTYWDGWQSQTHKKAYLTEPVNTGKGCLTDNDCKALDQCFANEKLAPNFGQIVNQTCEDNYFHFTTAYQYVKGSKYYKPASECPKEFTDGCCIYHPQVMVEDNWGWCNGRCGDASSVGGVGCYDGSNNASVIKDECKDDPAGTSTSTIRVIVAPK